MDQFTSTEVDNDHVIVMSSGLSWHEFEKCRESLMEICCWLHCGKCSVFMTNSQYISVSAVSIVTILSLCVSCEPVNFMEVKHQITGVYL